VTNRRLRLFGHIARSSPRKGHHRALAACIRQVPPDWKWPAGRPSHTWLRAIEADLGPLNFGLATAWRKATTRDEWRHIVDTAALQWSTLWKKKKKKLYYCSWLPTFCIFQSLLLFLMFDVVFLHLCRVVCSPTVSATWWISRNYDSTQTVFHNFHQ